MNKRPKSWYYFIVDHDQKLFSVQGPISTDHALNENIVAAQDAGRNVRSSSCWTFVEMQNAFMHWVEAGYQPVKNGILVTGPGGFEPHSTTYFAVLMSA